MGFSLLPLDIVAVYGQSWRAEKLAAFQAATATAVKYAETAINARHPSVKLHLRHLALDEVCAISDVSAMASVAIFDATDADAQLALLSGRLQGRGVPFIALCHEGAEHAVSVLGLRRSDLLLYPSIEQLDTLDSPLQQELLRAVPENRIHEELIYQFWFPRETSTIWVVCPQIQEPGEYADKMSPDFTYLDNLGDTDALLDVMVFLSQYYPKANIEHFSSSDLPEGHTSSNLVVIGGPGSEEISNELCGDMLRAMNACIGYSEDCEEMIVTMSGGQDPNRFKAEYRTGNRDTEHSIARGVRKDRGCFARFPNPLNENASVVLVNGIHTAGVAGAARVFGERREALGNFDVVLASGVNLRSFECHFEVVVLNGEVKVPAVLQTSILTLGVPEPGAVVETLAQVTSASGKGGNSATILLIAGDRGGTQVNQLQIPKEYDAIREAIRSCRHRDVVSVANPILAATRKHLAEAYRELPAIVHFAGHGDERSLSILEDREVIAKVVPLDADQLREMFKTMKPTVRLCVLNACSSTGLAETIVKEGAVECAIGWPAKVTDSDAIAFSRAFYGALGDGRNISDALSIAKVAAGTKDGPVLFAGSDLDTLVFITEESRSL